MCLVFVVEKLGPVFQVTLALNGITTGALLGLFTMGILFRKANTTGVLWGAIMSVLIVAFIVVGSFNVSTVTSALPLRTDGCETDLIQGLNFSSTTVTSTPDEDFWLFRISFMYFSFIGLIVVIVIGYPISLVTYDDGSILDERLLTPFMRSKEYKSKERLSGLSRQFEAEYSQIELKQLEMKNNSKNWMIVCTPEFTEFKELDYSTPEFTEFEELDGQKDVESTMTFQSVSILSVAMLLEDDDDDVEEEEELLDDERCLYDVGL
ncbi:Sodium-coupled monocarboxylate transporter 2 [Pseudolycoriella hygida]|uniref:Sodium-coupled monocarboxylate transporter 2 n=1 Tax=Pseudolycoriella hygida TaxID=35572 RepID=A0A9Q0S767_9DIPT|nr:Sodium-coupled monocarboxylate transporter 2 [Pseudolycoriella hygida]